MKKTILLFLFVLPVIVVFITIALAGFIGRSALVQRVNSVNFNLSAASAADTGHTIRWAATEGGYRLSPEVNANLGIDFQRFVTITPSRARFSTLRFDISNPDAVEVRGGRIFVKQDRFRSEEEVTIRVMHPAQIDPFFTIYVRTRFNANNFEFDGLKFSHRLLGEQISGRPAWATGVYVNANTQDFEFRRSEINAQTDFGRVMRAGLDIAPGPVMNDTGGGSQFRLEFLNTVRIESDCNGTRIDITRLIDGNFEAEFLATGLVTLTVSADWRNRQHEFEVVIRIT